jgi:predicted nucleotidyltransferase
MPQPGQIKKKKKIRQLLAALQPFEPQKVYLFGSWARGEEDELSDIDIVVIKDTILPFLKRLQELGKMLPSEIGAVDLLVYTPEEFAAMHQGGNAFAAMIIEEACLIYGR